ncbi:hypothetical protein [Undibacterium sp. Xuan67W]|uniref:hypothetical protein n=1 Tax=Undibacterium sp. Xuan67W TaxID=3413057 RepID=UPI003BF11FB3
MTQPATAHPISRCRRRKNTFLLIFQQISSTQAALVAATLLTLTVLSAGNAYAKPLLRCHVTYAGSTQIIETSLTTDPYAIVPVDIGGRFLFKAVMIAKEKTIDYIKLYAYFQTRHKDMPIHQATYYPPFTLSKIPVQLTPKNSLYAGDVERELQYFCTLQEVQP